MHTYTGRWQCGIASQGTQGSIHTSYMSMHKSPDILSLPVLMCLLKGLSSACLSISFYTAKLQDSICAHRCFQKSNARTIDEHMWTLLIPVWRRCISICELPKFHSRDKTWLYMCSQAIIAWATYACIWIDVSRGIIYARMHWQMARWCSKLKHTEQYSHIIYEHTQVPRYPTIASVHMLV